MLKYDIENTINTIKEHEIFLNNRNDTENSSDNSYSSDISLRQQHSIARKRWKILAKAIRKNQNEISMLNEEENEMKMNKTNNIDNDDDDDDDDNGTVIISNLLEKHNTTSVQNCNDDDLLASVRRFTTFNLVEQNHLSLTDKENLIGCSSDWFTYKLNVSTIDYCVNIHHINRPITALDLMGFNNTGNICVWPSEEALAYYAMTNINSFSSKMILELGGGMTCLAGLLIAKYGKPYGVHLTDGNALSVDNVKKTCRLNDITDCYVKCSILKWESYRKELKYEMEKFDYILCADCLFFDEARNALVDTIWYFLANIGTALVMAPRRGTTLDAFVNCAKAKGFTYTIVENYNETIWQRHLNLKNSHFYDENIHYPILIKLTK